MELLERHFDTAFDAPNGIKRLRELILTLAMQGKIVPQSPKDQPTNELLKSIEREKQLLVKSGKLKNLNVLPPVTEIEETFTLPESWAWVRLGAIAQHNSGKTLDSGRNSGTSRDYITTSNLYWGRFELDNVRQMLIRDEELERCTATIGDLLVCEGGEAGRAAVWEQESEVCFQNHIHRVRFHGEISPYYGFRFFEYLNASGQIEMYRKGVGISNMSSKALASIPFPLPPVPEQLRIIKRIDELMLRCDALEKLRAERDARRIAVHSSAVRQLLNVADTDGHIQAREFLGQHFGELYTMKENVTELRKAILQLAVMGKLVPQDPNDPPASEVLQRIQSKKSLSSNKRIGRASISGTTSASDNAPFSIPDGWQWTRIADLSESIVYGTSNKTCDDPSLVAVYRMGNIVNGRLIDDGFKYISPGIDDLPQLFLRDGDILFNRTNSYELVGKSAIYTGPDAHATFASYLIRIRLYKQHVSPVFINMAMNAPYFRQTQIEPEIVQQCGQANFNGTKLSLCAIPLPSLAEQYRIVAKIEEMMSHCDALETQIDAAKETQSALLNAMMAQYGGQRCA